MRIQEAIKGGRVKLWVNVRPDLKQWVKDTARTEGVSESTVVEKLLERAARIKPYNG